MSDTGCLYGSTYQYDYWDWWQQYGNWQTAVQEGWLCPRCKRINAPWKDHCNCQSARYIITNTDTTDGEQD